MAELFPMNLVDPVLHPVQQSQSARRDSGNHVAPILAAPLPDDQLRVFEAIKKACDIRNLSYQSLRDFTPAKTLGLGSPQNPQGVVLSRRDVVRLQGGLERVLQQCRRPLNAQVGLLFQALEGPRLFQFVLKLGSHTRIICVITHIVNARRIAQSVCAIARQTCPDPNTNRFGVLSCKSAGHTPVRSMRVRG